MKTNSQSKADEGKGVNGLKRVKQRFRDKFVPIFQPAYVEVFGIDENGDMHVLQIAKKTRYVNNRIQVFVCIERYGGKP